MNSEGLILKYIQNTLTSEEKLEFDRLIASDEDFRKEIAFHTDLKKVTENKDDDNFKSLLSDLEANAEVSTRKHYTKWYVAASIIVLLGLAYFLSLKPASNDELFTSYFEPYRNVSQPVVRGDEDKELKTIAFSAYENGDFKKALALFDQLLLEKEDPIISFYKANVFLKLNEAEKAIAILEKNIAIKDSFSVKRYWYLALAYLKVNKPKKSKENLKLLLETPKNTYKKKEATVLFKKLD